MDTNFYNDADQYDFFVTHTNEIPFYEKHCHGSILEVGCGTGRITDPLIRFGKNILGMDISQEMLNKFLNKITDINNPHTLRADARTFKCDWNTFDTIFAGFNTIQHFYEPKDMADFLECCQHNLTKDGKLILDVQNPNLDTLMLYDGSTRLAKTFVSPDGRKIELFETCEYDHTTQTNSITWHMCDNADIIKISRFNLRLYFPLELEAHLMYGGFKIEQRYGNFDESKFKEESPKQIIIASKI